MIPKLHQALVSFDGFHFQFHLSVSQDDIEVASPEKLSDGIRTLSQTDNGSLLVDSFVLYQRIGIAQPSILQMIVK
jgi:hypothetical protein